MDVDVLDCGRELGKGVDASFTRSPAHINYISKTERTEQ